MQPAQNSLMNQQAYYASVGNIWMPFDAAFGWWRAYPDASITIPAQGINTPAQASQNRYVGAEYRINPDGLVQLRGLIQKGTGGVAIANGDIVGRLPNWMRPRFGREMRWFGGSCVLRWDPNSTTGEVRVSEIYSGTAQHVHLENIMFYID